MKMNNIVPGINYETKYIVEEEDTEKGRLEALSSSRLLEWLEDAVVETVATFLPRGYQAVGIGYDLRILSCTAEGMQVRIVVELQEVGQETLTFAVKAYDDMDKICEGKFIRKVISVEEYAQRLQKKAEQMR